MRFRCCPPAKAGGTAAAGAKKGGSSLSRSTSGGAAKRPGAKTGLKRDPKRNPLPPAPHCGTFDRSTKARLKYFSTYGLSCLFSADTQTDTTQIITRR